MKKFYCWVIIFLWYPSVSLAFDAQQQDSSPHTKAWHDDFREGLTSTVDGSARWVDSFFAEGRFDDDYSSYGRLSIAPQWSGYDGFEVKSHFRARVDLPHAEEHFSAFIGRVDSDEYVDEGSAGRPSIIRSPSSDEEWLVGLGFDPKMNEKHRLSYSLGIRGGLDLDTYVRTRYRTDVAISDSVLTRLQSSAFWRDSDGFGVSQRVDLEASVTDSLLARWSSLGTFAQETNGLRWSSTLRGYKLYGDDKAVAIETWVEGQTDHAVPINDYGLRVLNRQRYLREWLFVETWVGRHWPRERVNESRQGQWMIGLELEVHFGTTNAYIRDQGQLPDDKSRSTSNGS